MNPAAPVTTYLTPGSTRKETSRTARYARRSTIEIMTSRPARSTKLSAHDAQDRERCDRVQEIGRFDRVAVRMWIGDLEDEELQPEQHD